MKASDYIVEYLIEKGITDVFGYPGGMVTHLMDSFSKYQDKIHAHVTYHEQGAAFAACGYAQTSGKLGIAYATSGPGATNLITGICNAYMDSIPTVFITGQVNSFEQKGNRKVRQQGFQETDIVSMVKNVTKYAAVVNDSKQLKWCLDKAFYIAQEGRKGPVLLDIAMDVTRAEIKPDEQEGYQCEELKSVFDGKKMKEIEILIENAKKPVFLLGRGMQIDDGIRKKLNQLKIPVVTSMIAIDVASGLEYCYGFIGAYGNRVANFVAAKSDLIISLGARLDIRQVGARREKFAPNAKIIRVDIDRGELEYKVHEDELTVCADARESAKIILDIFELKEHDYSKWFTTCDIILDKLQGYDDKKVNRIIQKISEDLIPEGVMITTDVGQNQVWVAQSFMLKKQQKVLFSGGHGAMGYSLPAAIGACIASKDVVYSFNGDGGFQMNMQELQLIARKQLPVKIFVFNNHSLGMIRHFQEMYFESNYFQTKEEGGYYVANFEKIADAYGIEYQKIADVQSVPALKELVQNKKPCLIEICLEENTYVFPKLEYGKPNQDQEPLIERELYDKLMELGEYNGKYKS